MPPVVVRQRGLRQPFGFIRSAQIFLNHNVQPLRYCPARCPRRCDLTEDCAFRVPSFSRVWHGASLIALTCRSRCSRGPSRWLQPRRRNHSPTGEVDPAPHRYLWCGSGRGIDRPLHETLAHSFAAPPMPDRGDLAASHYQTNVRYRTMVPLNSITRLTGPISQRERHVLS